MKHYLRTVVLLSIVAVCQTSFAGYSLIAYEGNANVHLMLFDIEHPEEEVISVEINSASEYRNLGNPGNILYFDSPPKMLAYAINRLLEKITAIGCGGKHTGLKLDYLGVFIAGYDFFAHELVCKKASGFGYLDERIQEKYGTVGAAGKCQTYDNGIPIWLERKENHFWRTFAWFNQELGQTVEYNHRLLKGDHHLMTQAARVMLVRETGSYELMPDVDLVQVSTCAPGYQVRNGRWVEESSVSPDNPGDGGFHQLGRDVCRQYLEPATTPFKPWKNYDSIVLNKLSVLPVAIEYAQQRNDSILNRWKNGFSNELGFATTMLLMKSAFPEKDEDIDRTVQEQLIPLIIGEPPMSHSTLHAVVESIKKLEQQGHVLLPDGKKNPIRLLGEFPWDELGLKIFFRFELPAETYRRLEFIIRQDYEPMLAIAATYIFKHPELFEEEDDNDDE